MNSALKQAIRVAGSQKALADMLGIHKSNVSLWVSGKPVPAKHRITMHKRIGVPFEAFEQRGTDDRACHR